MWKSNFAEVECQTGNRLESEEYGIYMSPNLGIEAEFPWIGMLIALLWMYVMRFSRI